MVFRCAVLVACMCTMPLRAGAAETASKPFDRVVVAPTKTSIYVGSVAMTMSEFVRRNGVFEADYTAKVVPFFFYNENGRLFVEVSDEQLAQLQRGEPIEVKGRAVRNDGAERRVECKATPTDARSGKLKVRVFYSKRIELIFNTTYQFGE